MSAPWGLPDEQGRYATYGLPAGHETVTRWGLPPEHFEQHDPTTRDPSVLPTEQEKP